MDNKQIIEIIKTVQGSDIRKFHYKEGQIELSLELRESHDVRNAEEFKTNSLELEDLSELNMKTINSPIVGTFYTSPSEDAPPYINVGDHIMKGQVVGIVEAMMLMNDIVSEYE